MKKMRVIRRDDHARDQDAKHIKHAYTDENPLDSLGDVPSGAFSFRCSDSNELHSLEGVSSLDNDGENTEESVKSNICGLKSGTSESARVFPILETSTVVVWRTA